MRTAGTSRVRRAATASSNTRRSQGRSPSLAIQMMSSIRRRPEYPQASGVQAMTRRYLVIYENGPENRTGFAPDVPAAPGTGHSLDEMRANLRERPCRIAHHRTSRSRSHLGLRETFIRRHTSSFPLKRGRDDLRYTGNIASLAEQIFLSSPESAHPPSHQPLTPCHFSPPNQLNY